MLGVGFSSGCGYASRVASENDRLRRQVMELQDQVKELQVRAESAEKRLEIEKQQHSSGAALPEGVHRPAISRIEIAGPSRGLDSDRDGRDDAVRIYLRTYDHRGRFMPAIATAQVTVAAVPAGSAAVTLATREFNIQDFEDAYRTGFGGTHYTLIVPLDQAPPPETESLTVTVKIADLLTGANHETEKIVNFDAGTAEPTGAQAK